MPTARSSVASALAKRRASASSPLRPRVAIGGQTVNPGLTPTLGSITIGNVTTGNMQAAAGTTLTTGAINATDFVVLSNPGYPDPFSGTPRAPGPANTELFDPNMNTPYAMHVTGGMKQDLGNGVTVSADYVYVRGYDQLRRRDLNAPPNGTALRPDATLGGQLIHE